MSHFSVLVIGSNVDEQLEPYDETIPVAPYSVGEVSAHDIDAMIECYKKEGVKFKDFDELYAIKGQEWNGKRWRQKADGHWIEISRYNPKSKWDWFEIGGRWAGSLELKPGVERIAPPNFSYGWNDADRAQVAMNRVDIAYKKDIANLNEISVFAVVKDGEWIESGTMGWWCIVDHPMDPDKWDEKVQEIIAACDDDELFTIVDCHI